MANTNANSLESLSLPSSPDMNTLTRPNSVGINSAKETMPGEKKFPSLDDIKFSDQLASLNSTNQPTPFAQFSHNFILQETFNRLYFSCLGVFEKRLTEKMDLISQKYEGLQKDNQELKFRLAHLENLFQMLGDKLASNTDLSTRFLPGPRFDHLWSNSINDYSINQMSTTNQVSPQGSQSSYSPVQHSSIKDKSSAFSIPYLTMNSNLSSKETSESGHGNGTKTDQTSNTSSTNSLGFDPTFFGQNTNPQLIWNHWMATFMAQNMDASKIINNHCSNNANSTMNTSTTNIAAISNSNTVDKDSGVRHNYKSMNINQHLSNSKDQSDIGTNGLLNGSPWQSCAPMRCRNGRSGRLKTRNLDFDHFQQTCSQRFNPYNKTGLHSPFSIRNMRRPFLNNLNPKMTHWHNSRLTGLTQMDSSDSPINQNLAKEAQEVLSSCSRARVNGSTTSSSTHTRPNTHVGKPVVILNPKEPREIFIGGVHTVSLPLWAYCKCLTMVRGEPHELGPRLCLRLLQSLFSLHYLVTHNYNGSGGKAPIDPTVMGAVLRQAQLQFGSGYFFTEPMALGKLRDYLNNAFRVMAFRQRKGERVRSPFWNDKGEPVHDLDPPAEFSDISDIIVIPSAREVDIELPNLDKESLDRI